MVGWHHRPNGRIGKKKIHDLITYVEELLVIGMC